MSTTEQRELSHFGPYTAGVPEPHGAREGRRSAGAAEEAREFEVVYRREYPIAVAFALRYADRDTAEEVAQAVFAAYWTGYTETPAIVFGADVDHTRSAILSAVKNRLRTLRRRSNTRKRKSRHVRAEIVPALRDAGAPERPAATHELSELVARAVNALPAQRRRVFCLVKLDGRPYDEVAEVLGISTHTVHRHLVKAHARLRAALAEYRDEPEERSYQMHDEQVIVGTKPGQE